MLANVTFKVSLQICRSFLFGELSTNCRQLNFKRKKFSKPTKKFEPGFF